MMQFQVTNECIEVCNINIVAFTGGSLLKVGDTETIQTFSAIDTPARTMIVGGIGADIAPTTAVAVPPAPPAAHRGK